MNQPAVSIIVPVYNEEEAIAPVLSRLSQLNPAPLEVLVVDGGSTDRTRDMVKTAGFEVVISPQLGRGPQMNLGANLARGQYLCFVHADTLVPADLVEVVNTALANPRLALGGFRSVMRGPNKVRWLSTVHNAIKTHYGAFFTNPYRYTFKGFRLLVGDQALFCRREDFMQVGGFPDQPLMEDLDLSVRLNRLGRNQQLARSVHTSDRRVARIGEWKANLQYLVFGLLWMLKTSPSTLARWYGHIR